MVASTGRRHEACLEYGLMRGSCGEGWPVKRNIASISIAYAATSHRHCTHASLARAVRRRFAAGGHCCCKVTLLGPTRSIGIFAESSQEKFGGEGGTYVV